MASRGPRPTIVVGYDGSDAARAALVFAARQAGTAGRVVVVHAFELAPDLRADPDSDSLLSRRRERGEALLAELPLGQGALAGPAYEVELTGGPAAQVIEAAARAHQADEIVVGARGLGRLRALLGSVSHELLHIADRPVVVIPTAAIEADVEASA